MIRKVNFVVYNVDRVCGVALFGRYLLLQPRLGSIKRDEERLYTSVTVKFASDTDLLGECVMCPQFKSDSRARADHSNIGPGIGLTIDTPIIRPLSPIMVRRRALGIAQ